ncbi:S8 family serine peptidase [Aliikangiella coralliicola]|uniref:S8 family serine peptidase n=1 Tax=Aliikangiella coralliicola TaxID=2592383 RepID=A0A545UER1_9GAMM|nr:S8 family serine peptidase [Aliikangiella coralliicola]TQV87969.1 S8 family serine peptidase [Aliikangiella coralliicola]
MKFKANKTLVASMVFAALSSASTIAYSADTIDVIVKLKNEQMPFSVSANRSLNAQSMSTQRLHQMQGENRKRAVQSFVSNKKITPKHIYNNVYHGFSATVTQEQFEALQNDSQVEGVYKDEIYTIFDPGLYQSNKKKHKIKDLKTTKKKRKLIDWPQVVPQGPIDSGAASSAYRGADQHVYVLDTGVDVRQKDIKDNLGLGYAPEFCNWPSNKKLCPMPFSDDNGHGTHVSGTVAAGDNAINALGMAPEAIVHPVKVCTYAGSCPGSSILAGLNWAVFDMLGRGEPAVANLSLGGPTSLDPGDCTDTGYVGDNFVAESYCNAAHQGMVVVVAAGNSSDDAAGYSPAGFNSTITVSSYTTYDDSTGEAVFTNFSNYGDGPNTWGDKKSGAITIAAPGDTIVSLNRTHANLLLSGTSMASPAVAGAAALVMEKHPQSLDFSAFQNVRQMLVDNAITPAFYSTEPDNDGNPLNFPHEEGILSLRFLDE